MKKFEWERNNTSAITSLAKRLDNAAKSRAERPNWLLTSTRAATVASRAEQRRLDHIRKEFDNPPIYYDPLLPPDWDGTERDDLCPEDDYDQDIDVDDL